MKRMSRACIEKLTKEEVEEHHKDNRIGSLFIDSGGHSLYTKYVMKQGNAERQRNSRYVPNYSWYKSREFRDYLDTYAAWIKENIEYLDFYVGVDAIFNPEITWKAQRYLEKEHGLSPLPVIHYGTSLDWVRKYVDAGYEFIGLGGLGQEVHKNMYYAWADEVYSKILCANPQRLPMVRTHGFAMTSWSLLTRYPWWSVDSASWVKAAGFGSIYVPRKKKGKFDFSVPPFAISASEKSSAVASGRHTSKLLGCDRDHVTEWLSVCGVVWGKSTETGEVEVEGVCNSHLSRCIVNIMFFKRFCDSIPQWPWPLKVGGFAGYQEI